MSILIGREELRYDPFIFLGSERTGRVDERPSGLESSKGDREELTLETRFFSNIIERPESVGSLILERDPTLSRTRRIEEYTIKLYLHAIIDNRDIRPGTREKVPRVHLDSLYDRRSLKLSIVHELIETDLVLLDGKYPSLILHDHRHLGRLGPGCGTDIEYNLIRFNRECQYWEHRGNRLEIDIPSVKCLCPLDRIFILSIEEVRSVDSIKSLYYNPLFFKFIKYFISITFECIETQ